MASYTTTLGTILQAKYDIGLKDYPIFKEEYREVLNKKIIDHFYDREIGLETPRKFVKYLNRKMREIMPYYNQLYKSEEIDFNPLFNIDITETFTKKADLTGNTKTNGSLDNTTKTTSNGTEKTTNNNEIVNTESDTPDTQVSMSDIKNSSYASKANYSVGDTTDTTTTDGTENVTSGQTATNNMDNTQNTNEEYTKKMEGSSAGLPFSKAIKQWREIMLNIDMQIIDELEVLFMQLW